jgi:hypothetical protein
VVHDGELESLRAKYLVVAQAAGDEIRHGDGEEGTPRIEVPSAWRPLLGLSAGC